MNQKSQIIFIASETRSGSTFLSYMLGTNPQSAHLGEFYRPFKLGAQKSCRLCEAKGLDECEIMGNLCDVPFQEAHTHALNCFKKHGVSTLIDCSKDLDWIEEVSQIYKSKRENIFIQILEAIDPDDGKLLLLATQKKFRIKGLTIPQLNKLFDLNMPVPEKKKSTNVEEKK